MIKDRLKAFALKHNRLLNAYRNTFGKLKTKYYFDAQKKALQRNGNLLMQKIDSALEDKGARFFIDCGTLLGMVRDQKLIAHDRDMDYGIYFDDKFTKEMLDEAMLSIGMKKHREFYFRGRPVEVSYSNGLTNIDFFDHIEDDEFSKVYAFYRDVEKKYPSDKHYSVLEMRRKLITGISRVNISGMDVNIPENAEEYLESAYTENWRIPDPTWSYFSEPGMHRIENEFGIKK